MPVGTIQYFAGNTPPEDWLLCNGNTISRTEYEELFSIIGTTYGTGDGSTTFQLPNLIGRFAEGAATAGNIMEAGLPNIKGAMNERSRILNYSIGTGAFGTAGSTGANIQYGSDGGGGNLTFDASLSNPIYGKSETVQPASLTLLPIIRAK